MDIQSKFTRLLGLLSAGLLGACGSTEQGEMNVAAADAGQVIMDAALDYTCPPPPPFGIRKGKSVRNVILEDCDGNTYQIHGLCGHKAAWFFVYAGW